MSTPHNPGFEDRNDDDWQPSPEDYAVLDSGDAMQSGGSADYSTVQLPSPTSLEVASDDRSTRRVIGRVSATENAPSSSEEFQFWMSPDEIVNPFDIIEAEHLRSSITYGLVTNIEHITDAPSHLANFVSMDFGDVYAIEQTPRTGVNIATATVMSNETGSDDEGVYMPVQNSSVCHFASQDGILRALGIDRIPQDQRIPAGMIALSDGTTSPVFLDADFVLGPEAAHINITGISGLATKTSFATFIIQSILQTIGEDDVAVIMLNVKHDDLLHIHERNPELTEADRANWSALGLEPKPFQRVHYLLPAGKMQEPNYHGSTPPQPHEVYAYSLQDVVGTADRHGPGLATLLRTPDSTGTMASVVGEIEQRFHTRASGWRSDKTWESLLNNEPLYKESKPQQLAENKPASVGKFLRLMRSAVLHNHSGIFVNHRAQKVCSLGERVRNIKGGETLVVDIARLRDHERALVVSDVINEIHRMYAEESTQQQDGQDRRATRGTLPEKVLVFVDELNKYAPQNRSEESTVADNVLDIAARGRSLGVILVSAEQYMSEVHHQVVGNCGTRVVGRSDSTELTKEAYRGIVANDLRAHITRLRKGDMLLAHPVFRQPIRVQFPRPAYRLIGHKTEPS